MLPQPKKVVETSSKFLGEFKEFISRGNVVDLAIGVIMGAAFGKIVTALVNDIIMPPIGLVLRGIDFKDLYIPLNGKHYGTLAEAQKDGAAILCYGNFINTVIEFVINTLRRTDSAAPAKLTKSEELLTDIRDLLKKSE